MSDLLRANTASTVKSGKARRAATGRPMIDRYRWWEVAALYAGIAVFLSFVLAPFIEGFLVSLKPLAQLFSTPYSFIPKNGSFDSYINMWTSVPNLGRYIFNSLLISTVETAIVVIIAIPAAYAFARFKFPASGLLLAAFLAVNMFSGAVLLIPLFRLMRTIGLLNTYWAQIVPGAAFLIPSSIWLLRTYLLRIPRELDEAAWVDGASRLYTMRRVILPLAMPGVVVVSIMTFIGAYAQQFLRADLQLQDRVHAAADRAVRLFRQAGSAVERADGGQFRRNPAGHDHHRVPAALPRRRPNRRGDQAVGPAWGLDPNRE